MKYSYDKDKIIKDLDENGYSFLPSIKSIVDSHDIYNKYLDEGISDTYAESTKTHKLLLKIIDLAPLFSELYSLAKKNTKQKIDPSDQYLISRHVRPGQVSEGYRGHFDSHFITIVLPVQIPKTIIPKNSGQLIALPKARKIPRSELSNIYGKIHWKKYNSENEYDKLIIEKKALELDFSDYKPLIFVGNSTFHGNRPLSGSNEPRLSMLCHLFDTSPKYGVGAFMRLLRNR